MESESVLPPDQLLSGGGRSGVPFLRGKRRNSAVREMITEEKRRDRGDKISCGAVIFYVAY